MGCSGLEDFKSPSLGIKSKDYGTDLPQMSALGDASLRVVIIPRPWNSLEALTPRCTIVELGLVHLQITKTSMISLLVSMVAY